MCSHKPVFREQRLKIEELLDETGSEYVAPLSHSRGGITNQYTEQLSSFWPLNSSKPKKERELASWLHLMLLLISCKIFAALENTAPYSVRTVWPRASWGMSLGQQEVTVDKRSKFRNASLDFILIQSLVKLSLCDPSQDQKYVHTG